MEIKVTEEFKIGDIVIEKGDTIDILNESVSKAIEYMNKAKSELAILRDANLTGEAQRLITRAITSLIGIGR